jgi:hypothetical protein
VSSSGKKEGNGTLLTGSQIQAREAHQRGSRGSSRELQADELVAITNPQPRDYVLSSRRPRLILRTTPITTLVRRRLLLLLPSHTHLRAHSRLSALLSTMTAFQHSSELDSACTIRWFFFWFYLLAGILGGCSVFLKWHIYLLSLVILLSGRCCILLFGETESHIPFNASFYIVILQHMCGMFGGQRLTLRCVHHAFLRRSVCMQ